MYLCKTEFSEIDLFWYLTVCKQKLQLYQTKLLELELYD